MKGFNLEKYTNRRRPAKLGISAIGAAIYIAISMAAFIHSSAVAGELSRLTAQLPDIDAPPQGHAQWVARSMRLNGLPMTIKSFNTPMSVDDVLNFYEHWWMGKELAQYSRSKNGEWRILGIHGEQTAVTIEARSTIGGTEGTITVSPKIGKVIRPTTLFPRPVSTQLVTLQEYDDDGIEAEHIRMTSPRDIGVESREFASLLQSQGWQLLVNRRAASQTDGYVIEAQKGGQQAQLVFKSIVLQSAQTDIVVVWVKS